MPSPDTHSITVDGLHFIALVRVGALGGKLLKRYGGDACTSGWCRDTEGNGFDVHQRIIKRAT